jgi:hypothetical protein
MAFVRPFSNIEGTEPLKTIYSATRQLVRPHLHEIRRYQRLYPKLEVPTRRRTPTALEIWKHFCRAMITSQQLITEDLWNRLDADARWRALRNGGPMACPSERTLTSLFRDQRIRFPQQKATRVKRAQTRDFTGLAAFARSLLRDTHDKRARPDTLRREEVRLAVALQEELSGCGVAPKIARLALRFCGEFEQLVPIDSRWQNALAAVGVEVEQVEFARESSYVLIENEIARAAQSLSVPPALCDAAVFGWLAASIAQVP